MVDWGELPRELTVRIVFFYKRARAASKIQAVWRGRDTRHFLAHPASRVFNSRHPRFAQSVHLRKCTGCFLQELYMHNLLNEVFTTAPTTGAWSVRCLYLVHFDLERVRYRPGS